MITRRKQKTPNPSALAGDMTAAVMTPARQATLEAIRSSWSIAHIADMFTTEEARKKLHQDPPNDDFFEEATLNLFQTLAKMTEDRKEEVQAELKRVWSARCHGRLNLKAGDGNAGKNQNLREDLQKCIKHFGPEEQRVRKVAEQSNQGLSVVRTGAARSKKEHTKDSISTLPRRPLGPDSEVTTDESSSAPMKNPGKRRPHAEDTDIPLSPSSARSQDEQITLALHGVTTYWAVESPIEVVPEVYYMQHLKTHPRSWNWAVLERLYYLAKDTIGRADRVSEELVNEFKDVNKYDAGTTLKKLIAVHDKFASGAFDKGKQKRGNRTERGDEVQVLETDDLDDAAEVDVSQDVKKRTKFDANGPPCKKTKLNAQPASKDQDDSTTPMEVLTALHADLVERVRGLLTGNPNIPIPSHLSAEDILTVQQLHLQICEASSELSEAEIGVSKVRATRTDVLAFTTAGDIGAVEQEVHDKGREVERKRRVVLKLSLQLLNVLGARDDAGFKKLDLLGIDEEAMVVNEEIEEERMSSEV